MSWFAHRHYWVSIRVNIVKSDKGDGALGEIITEKCFGCGGIRTVSVSPGQAPIIRLAEQSA